MSLKLSHNLTQLSVEGATYIFVEELKIVYLVMPTLTLVFVVACDKGIII